MSEMSPEKLMAMIYCIAAPASLVLGAIPYVGMLNCLIAPISLIIWIVLLVKFASLKAAINSQPAP